MAEVWKLVPSTGGHLEVSTLGRVRKAINRSPTKARQPQWHLYRTYERPDGLVSVDTSAGAWLLHRLVWTTFRGPLAPGMAVVHRDGDKTNCALRNLKQVSQYESVSTKLTGRPRPESAGSHHPRASIDEAMARKIHARLKTAPRKPNGHFARGALKKIAEDLDVGRHVVMGVARGDTWHHVA
ncbi:MAG: HNH endonuclease signature motif containing protein [Pseudomonadota bacterium]